MRMFLAVFDILAPLCWVAMTICAVFALQH
jgi:hypothetical protein